MPSLPVFNFSYWKPQPQTKLVEYSNYGGAHTTISNLDVESIGSSATECDGSGTNGSGTDGSPFNLCLDENYNYGHNTNTCNGDGTSTGAVWYESVSCITSSLYAEVNYYGSVDIGIAVSTDHQDIINFIGGQGYLLYGNYSYGSGYASASLTPDSVGQTIYVIVYEADGSGYPLNGSNSDCGSFDVYAYQYDCEGEAPTINWEYVPADEDLLISDNSEIPDQVQFKNDTSLYVGFDYIPTLQVDRTIEDEIGSSLTCTNISVEMIAYTGINERIVYYSNGYTTSTVTINYDAGVDAYYIYPTSPFTIYQNFHTLLFVVSYTTNAGVIKKQQRISLIDSDLYTNVFVTTFNGCGQTFYIPECTRTVNQIITFGTAINPTVVNFGTNLFSATFGSPVQIGSSQTITYSIAGDTNVYSKTLIPIQNCSIIDCGNSTSNAGGQGVISYSIELNNAVGMFRTSWSHYGIPDQIRVALPSNIEIYNQHRITSGSGEVFLEKTTTGSNFDNRASVTITAPNVGTAWANSFGCIVSYTDVPSGAEFSTSMDKPKENFVKRIGPSAWETAFAGDHYTIISENITANSLSAISNEDLRLINDDDKYTTRLVPLTAYVDPFSQQPIVHYAVKFEHASDTTAIFKEIYLRSDDNDFVFSKTRSPAFGINTYEWDPIVIPYCSTLPGEKYFIRSSGSIEYVKGHTSYIKPLSVIHRIDSVPIRDIFHTYGSGDTSNGYPYAPSLSFTYSPAVANDGLSTIQPNISGSGAVIIQNYSCPFYHLDEDEKFIIFRLMDTKASDDTNTLSISSQAFNSVDGDDLQTSTLTTGNVTTSLTHYINSYNTEGLRLSYSNKKTDRGQITVFVYDVVQPLLNTETYVYSTSAGSTSYFPGLYPTFTATNGVHYTLQTNTPEPGFSTISSLSDDLKICKSTDRNRFLGYNPSQKQ